MNEQELSVLIAELKNGGPSPFVPDQAEPWPVTFDDEGQAIVGRALSSAFGDSQKVHVIATTYRFILYLPRPGGKDQCRSYWFKVDFGDWAWQEPDGFTVTGVETGEFDMVAEGAPPIFGWQTHLLGSAGERRLLETVQLSVLEYHDQNQGGYVAWNQPITGPGQGDGGEAYPAWGLFGVELSQASESPGRVDLEALWVLSQDPHAAGRRAGGYIPPDAALALRPDSPTVRADSTRVDKSTGEKASRARKAASKALEVGAQVKSAVEGAQEVASLLGGPGGGPSVGAPAQQAAPGQGRTAEAVTSSPSIGGVCPNCGQPVSPGVLFCGKCGQQLAEAIAEEVKDEIQGRVEDAVVDKAKQLLEEGEQSKAKGRAKKRKAKPSSGKADEKPRPKKAKAKASAKEKEKKRTAKRAAEESTTEEGPRCPSCGRPVESDWKVCPYCTESLVRVCPECGRETQPEWKFCPYCTAQF